MAAAFQSFLALVGTVVLLHYAASLARVIYNLFIRGGRSLRRYGGGSEKDSWAVVTGASDGIGKEFALQLASSGFNIILLARTASKLSDVASAIKAAHSVETLVILFDFARTDLSAYHELIDMIGSRKIRVLVNNVGVSHAHPNEFWKEPLGKIHDIININVTSVLTLTHLVLPRMLELSKPCLVINVGSFAGLGPHPLLGAYAASKGFLLLWSQALGAELASTLVEVTCLSTYLVVSNMSRIRRSSITAPTPSDYVAATLSRLGNHGGSSLPGASSPHPAHGLLNWLVENLGTPKLRMMMAHAILKRIQARALRRSLSSKKD